MSERKEWGGSRKEAAARNGKRVGRKPSATGRQLHKLSPAAAAHLRTLAVAHYGRQPTDEEEDAYLGAMVLLKENDNG